MKVGDAPYAPVGPTIQFSSDFLLNLPGRCVSKCGTPNNNPVIMVDFCMENTPIKTFLSFGFGDIFK